MLLGVFPYWLRLLFRCVISSHPAFHLQRTNQAAVMPHTAQPRPHALDAGACRYHQPSAGHSITATMQDDRYDQAAMEDAQPTASFDKTIDDFRSGTANYQALLQNFLDQAAAIKDTISKDRAALAQEREHFEQERARVAQVGPPYAT